MKEENNSINYHIISNLHFNFAEVQGCILFQVSFKGKKSIFFIFEDLLFLNKR